MNEKDKIIQSLGDAYRYCDDAERAGIMIAAHMIAVDQKWKPKKFQAEVRKAGTR